MQIERCAYTSSPLEALKWSCKQTPTHEQYNRQSRPRSLKFATIAGYKSQTKRNGIRRDG
ncbi:hypothetical protein GX48_05044 [Paracoccidioides brasiliensis]|nr:hypothetical protein GX48_05044 [Paracoccidioides brasiliensis]